MQAKRYVVIGRVQGVGFRWFVLRRAESLGLRGWVRNCRNGTVEVWAEGTSAELEDLESLLEAGPAGAFVRELKTEEVVPSGRFSGFDITY